MTTTAITWAWGTQTKIDDFNPATDVLDFGWMGSQYFTISEVNGSVVIDIPINHHSYTLTGVTLDQLSMANITAKDPSVMEAWSAVLDTGETTVLDWAWDTNTVLDFNPAVDTLDFAWMSAKDFTMTEVNGSVVIYMPAARQTYILEGVELSDLSMDNFKANDSTALAELSATLAAGAQSATHLSGDTAIAWDYGTQKVIDFDPATDTLDFGTMSASDFALVEVDGSLTILIPASQQSYTLEGVTLSDLSLANIAALDGTTFAEWSTALSADAVSHGYTLTPITWDYGAQTVLDFDPATQKLDLGWLSASDFSIAEVNGSVMIFIPSNQHTYTLEGVTLADLSADDVIAMDSAAYAEVRAAIDAGDTPAAGGSSAPVTTTIAWVWDGSTVIDFDPSKDKLDFAWISADDFTITEANGSVVIFLPADHETYVLEGVSLADLTMANIVGQDQTTLDKWGALVPPAPETGTGDAGTGGTGSADTGSGDTGTGDTGTGDAGTGSDTGSDGSSTVEPVYADPWSPDTIYWGGDQASVGNVVYEAKWWTLGVDPETDHGADGSGHVWGVVGYVDTTPVAPEAPDDLAALTTTETSTVLSWDAPEIMGVGTISGYAIYQDGELIGTTTDRSYKVTGLSADTTYTFSVVAIDEAGASDASSPISLTTHAAGSDAPDGQYFAPYMEVWLPSSPQMADMAAEAGVSAVTLSFIVGTGPNEIGWAGAGTLDDDVLSDGTHISDLVAQMQSQGVDVAISFGGGLGQEPALYYDNVDDLTAAYQSVIDKYHVTHIDFDIEGDALTDEAASARRNEALVALEEQNPDLNVSFTLPASPDGLTPDALQLVAEAQAAGVDIDTVNIMVMNYGEGNDSGDMGDDAIAATEATIAQLEAIGIDAQVAVTPMAGVNDIPGETFTLEDAQQLVDYADGNDHIAYLAMWSLGRDHSGTVEEKDTSSGLSQHDYDFSKIFATV